MQYPEDQRFAPDHATDVMGSALPTSNEKLLAIVCHLLGYCMIVPFGNIVGPLIIWQLKKDESAFITRHALACLNFQISIMIYLAVFTVLSFAIVGIPFLIATAICGFVMPIIGAVKAANGEEYDYPLSLTFVQ